ncbi:DUF4962 domain-containing protein [Phycisphaerales bacterium AB-hyl4]|uniref:DUF4962 domain-containing protein n=1 Tax=Natronomicrosphaera hydrolytica TaxID=3242702 RepID=A0ABV4U9D3_9BACT
MTYGRRMMAFVALSISVAMFSPCEYGTSAHAAAASDGDVALVLDFDRYPITAGPAGTTTAVTVSPPKRALRPRDSAVGQYVTFDGRDDVLVLDSLSPELKQTLAGAFTLEMDMMLKALGMRPTPTILEAFGSEGELVLRVRIIYLGSGDKETRVQVTYHNQDGKQNHVLMHNSSIIASPASQRIPSGQWVHVSVTFEPDQAVTLFIDGIRNFSAPLEGRLAEIQSIRFGGDNDRLDHKFIGALDRFRITAGILHDRDTSALMVKQGQQRMRASSREKWRELLRTPQADWHDHHPRLIITPARLAHIQQRLQTGRGPELLQRFLEECNAWIDPESPQYYDPQTFELLQDRYHQLIPALLCMGTQLSGNPAYAERAGEIAMAAAKHVGYDEVAASRGQIANVAGTAMMLALAYDWGFDHFTPEQRKEVRLALMEIAAGTYDQLTDPMTRHLWVLNWNAMGISALGLSSLAIADEVDAPVLKWLDHAERLASEYANFAVGSDGGFHEGPAYFFYGVQHLMVFFEALHSATGRDLFVESNMSKIMDYMAYMMLPGGRAFMNNRFTYPGAGNVRHRHMPLIFRDRVDSDSPEWFWQQMYEEDKFPIGSQLLGLLWYRPTGEELEAPDLPLAKWFRDTGLVGFRSGWGEDDIAGIFDAHRTWLGAHDQLDDGQFTLFGYGGRWVVESGGRNLSNAADRDAQNLVTVEGTPSPPRTHNNYWTDSYITDFCHDDRIATATEADLASSFQYGYGWRMETLNQTREPNTRDRFDLARRQLVFMREETAPPYLLVFDELRQDDDEHKYTWHLHTGENNAVRLVGNRAILTQPKVAPQFLSHPLQPGWEPGPKPRTASSGLAEYEVHIPRDGEYVLWGYGRAGTAQPGGMDSFFITFAGKERMAWSAGCPFVYKWQMVNNGEPDNVFNLKEGSHTLTVTLREPESRVAKFMLTAKGESPISIDRGSGDTSQGIVIDAADPVRLRSPFQISREEERTLKHARADVWLLTPSADLEAEPFLPQQTPIRARLRASTTAKHARFLALIYPHRPEMPQPEIEPITIDNGQAWRVRWPDCEDVIVMNEGDTVTTHGFTSDAKVLIMRFVDDQLTAYVMQHGQTLTASDHSVRLTLSGGPGTAMYSADHLAISGKRVNDFAITGWAVEHVTAHGKPVTLQRADNGLKSEIDVIPKPVLKW